jgi:hypothetical protein
MNIGVLLRDGPSSNALRGRTVQFQPSGTAQTIPDPAANPQFTVLEPKRKRWRR